MDEDEDNNEQRVVVSLVHRRRLPEMQKNKLDDEAISNLAYQAVKLPTTLSKSQIEQLGLALLIGKTI